MVDSIQIYVKTMSAKYITVAVKITDSIEYVKLEIQRKEEIPVNQQQLMYHGQQLEDAQTLSDYHIQKDDILHLVVKSKG